jgi:hypothetical protein
VGTTPCLDAVRNGKICGPYRGSNRDRPADSLVAITTELTGIKLGKILRNRKTPNSRPPDDVLLCIIILFLLTVLFILQCSV